MAKGKPYPIEEKALAMAAAQLAESSAAGELVTSVPARTIRAWVAQFEMMDDSELDAWIAAKRRALSASYLVLEEVGQQLAYHLAHNLDGNGFKAAMTGAGIACDKTKGMGQPKPITTYASTEDRTLLDAFQAPAEAPSAVEPHADDAR